MMYDLKMGVFAIVLLSLSSIASAVEVKLSWINPTQDCEGVPLGATDLIQGEVFMSGFPIVMVDRDPCGGVTPLPNGLGPPIQVDLYDNVHDMDLSPGPYYVRMRARNLDGWSDLSNQLHFVVTDEPETSEGGELRKLVPPTMRLGL
jgi:hypothetical protein